MSNIFQNIAPPSWVPQLPPTGCFFATRILWRIVGDRSRGRHGGLVPENQRTVWLPEGTMCLFSLFTFLVEGILRELVFRIFECFVRECLPWDYFSPFTFFVEGILPLARRKKIGHTVSMFYSFTYYIIFQAKTKDLTRCLQKCSIPKSTGAMSKACFRITTAGHQQSRCRVGLLREPHWIHLWQGMPHLMNRVDLKYLFHVMWA